MSYPPNNPRKIAHILKKDCGTEGGIEYAESIVRGATSPQYRKAYREAKEILMREPETV